MGPPPIIAASSRLCTTAATRSPSTSRMPSTARGTATSTACRMRAASSTIRSSTSLRACLDEARDADVVVKCSGVGVLDDVLEEAVLELKRPAAGRLLGCRRAGHPASACSEPERSISRADPAVRPGADLRRRRPPWSELYERLVRRQCIPIYNALSPRRIIPLRRDAALRGDLAFCGNRMPDRECRVAGVLLQAGASAPEPAFSPRRQRLGRTMSRPWPTSRFSDTSIPRITTLSMPRPLAVLNVCRDSMARFGLLAADAHLRSRRRRGLHHHRRLGRGSTCSWSPGSNAWRSRRGRRRRDPRRALARPGPAHWANGPGSGSSPSTPTRGGPSGWSNTFGPVPIIRWRCEIMVDRWTSSCWD